MRGGVEMGGEGEDVKTLPAGEGGAKSGRWGGFSTTT